MVKSEQTETDELPYADSVHFPHFDVTEDSNASKGIRDWDSIDLKRTLQEIPERPEKSHSATPRCVHHQNLGGGLGEQEVLIPHSVSFHELDHFERICLDFKVAKGIGRSKLMDHIHDGIFMEFLVKAQDLEEPGGEHKVTIVSSELVQQSISPRVARKISEFQQDVIGNIVNSCIERHAFCDLHRASTMDASDPEEESEILFPTEILEEPPTCANNPLMPKPLTRENAMFHITCDRETTIHLSDI